MDVDYSTQKNRRLLGSFMIGSNGRNIWLIQEFTPSISFLLTAINKGGIDGSELHNLALRKKKLTYRMRSAVEKNKNVHETVYTKERKEPQLLSTNLSFQWSANPTIAGLVFKKVPLWSVTFLDIKQHAGEFLWS